MYRQRATGKKAIAAYAGALLFLFLLQTCFVRVIAIGGIAPMLLIPAIICVSQREGQKLGAVMGLITGFLCDVTVGSVMGYYAAIFLVLGFIARKIADGESIITMYIVSGGTYAVMTGLYWLYSTVILGGAGGFGNVIGIYFFEFLYSAPFAAAIYFWFDTIHVKLSEAY